MPNAFTAPLRGEVIQLENARARAEIVTVGAALNAFEVEGEPMIVEGPLDSVMIGYRGALVAPWPNRLGDGVYAFDGESFEVPLNEHERRTALHGLTPFAAFSVVEHSEEQAVLELDITPTPGYPFPLAIRVTYRLEDATLHTVVTATNRGARRAPYGVCPHPYLLPGDTSLPLDEWRASVPATKVLEVDDRLLPTALVPLTEHPELALESGAIGAKQIDHAYTGFTRGEITVESEKARVRMLFDPAALPWAQIHTADHSDPALNRAGLAVEPMTCPPDAMRTGEDLIVLEPGQSVSHEWSIVGEILA